MGVANIYVGLVQALGRVLRKRITIRHGQRHGRLAEKSCYLNGTLLYLGIARKYLNGKLEPNNKAIVSSAEHQYQHYLSDNLDC